MKATFSFCPPKVNIGNNIMSDKQSTVDRAHKAHKGLINLINCLREYGEAASTLEMKIGGQLEDLANYMEMSADELLAAWKSEFDEHYNTTMNNSSNVLAAVIAEISLAERK